MAKDDPERARERAREWYAANKPRAQARSTVWYQANKERARERMRANRAKDPERHRAYSRKHKWKKYGLTPEAYAALLAMQGGVCAICQQEGVLAVDHDHETGAVRGLLCGPCNRAIGLLRDDPDVIARAEAYVLGEIVYG